jgi:2-polyprenyl-6-methoxyphenol hydroxylase-like FAD-dependent oxidoreductase
VTMTSQVLVVGAGPVGLTLAAELKRYGVSVRIVDKASSRTDKSKALVVWSRTLELLARAGCAEAFVAAGCKVVAVNLNAGGRPLGRVTFDAVDSPYPYALMLPQSDTERLLEEHGAALGVTVEREVELTTFVADGEGATAELRHADGRIETVRADWLVGCDGAHSAVRHGLGFTFEGDTLRSDWVLADVHLAGVPVPSSELAMYAHAEDVLALFPIAPGRYRVIADVGDTGAAPPAEPTLDEVQALLDRRGPGGIAASDPIWLSAFRINERKVKSYRAGRVFLAGDAAHVHSPAGGQGMNTGMQDAFNLAWKLAMAARGVAGERLLASYDAERSAVGDMVLRNAGRLTAAATMKEPAGPDGAEHRRQPGAGPRPGSRGDGEHLHRDRDRLPRQRDQRSAPAGVHARSRRAGEAEGGRGGDRRGRAGAVLAPGRGVGGNRRPPESLSRLARSGPSAAPSRRRCLAGEAGRLCGRRREVR